MLLKRMLKSRYGTRNVNSYTIQDGGGGLFLFFFSQLKNNNLMEVGNRFVVVQLLRESEQERILFRSQDK